MMETENSTSDINTQVLAPGTNRTVRMLVQCDGLLRPLIWTQVGPDGSVYFGPRMEITFLRGVGKQPIADEVSFQYSEAEDIGDTSLLERFHISFHPSGAINVGSKRFYRTRWEHLEIAHQLCLIMFAHPTTYQPVNMQRTRDIILDDIVDEARPLHAKILVCQLSQKQLHVVPSMVRQRNIVLEYSGLTRTADFFLQIAFGYGVTGSWPQTMGIAFASSTQPG